VGLVWSHDLDGREACREPIAKPATGRFRLVSSQNAAGYIAEKSIGVVWRFWVGISLVLIVAPATKIVDAMFDARSVPVRQAVN
jgi:hypothetical protein